MLFIALMPASDTHHAHRESLPCPLVGAQSPSANHIAKVVATSPARFVPERFELADGDFVDLAWSGDISQGERPLIVLFHGLEGSIHSHYAKGLFAHLQRQGDEAVLMHFRGCSGEPNRLLQAYHSGAIEDAQALIAELGRRFPGKPMIAIGYSLGATCWSICWRGPARRN